MYICKYCLSVFLSIVMKMLIHISKHTLLYTIATYQNIARPVTFLECLQKEIIIDIKVERCENALNVNRDGLVSLSKVDRSYYYYY